MICLSCSTVIRGRLCNRCAATLRPAAERLLPGGLRLVAAFEHDGAARVLAHHLKYRGVVSFAELAADVLAEVIPRAPLVPIPRVWSRKAKYGIDPAGEIANALGRRLGVPILRILAPAIHARRRAGRDHSRPVSSFRARRLPDVQVILVDDVVTTGATLRAAAGSLGVEMVRVAVAANVVADVSNVRRHLD